MRKMKWASRIAFAMLIVVVIGFGLAALSSVAEAKGPCRCPLIYAPVQCDNGRIYPNLCEAQCHNAKNCVPLPLY